jgi:hypothetical protein
MLLPQTIGEGKPPAGKEVRQVVYVRCHNLVFSSSFCSLSDSILTGVYCSTGGCCLVWVVDGVLLGDYFIQVLQSCELV